jgi:heme/copper-type cytochrome/quinol oxidase subunit 2
MFLSSQLKENQNKRTEINSNRILYSPVSVLPISYLIFFFILVFSHTSVYCQKKQEVKTKSANTIERQKTSNENDQVKSTDRSAVSTSQTQVAPQTYNHSIPANFDINSVSADVRQKLEENKKNGRPFFEGISLALEFELMDDIDSETELVERIQKNTKAKTPIQIKKKAESVYWIITDTKTPTESIKEIVSDAGLKVNFISKSYRLK